MRYCANRKRPKELAMLRVTLSTLLLFSLSPAYADNLLNTNQDHRADFLEKWFDRSANRKSAPVFSAEKQKDKKPITPSKLLTDYLKTKDFFSGELEWKEQAIKPLLSARYLGINVDEIYIDRENKVWEINKEERFVNTRGKTFAEATTICDQLNLSGLDNFRLPTKEELGVIHDKNFPFSRAAEFYSRNYWSSTKAGDKIVTLETFKNRDFSHILPSRHNDFRCISSFFRDT